MKVHNYQIEDQGAGEYYAYTVDSKGLFSAPPKGCTGMRTSLNQLIYNLECQHPRNEALQINVIVKGRKEVTGG